MGLVDVPHVVHGLISTVRVGTSLAAAKATAASASSRASGRAG